MAGHLGVDEATFKSTYMNAEETGLLVDPETGVCKLWAEGQGCTVYPVKPQQCTDFPETWCWTTNKRNAMYAAGRCQNFKYPRNMT